MSKIMSYLASLTKILNNAADDADPEAIAQLRATIAHVATLESASRVVVRSRGARGATTRRGRPIPPSVHEGEHGDLVEIIADGQDRGLARVRLDGDPRPYSLHHVLDLCPA